MCILCLAKDTIVDTDIDTGRIDLLGLAKKISRMYE